MNNKRQHKFSNNINSNRIKTSDSISILYACPMHPDIKKSTPGNCSICGMTLEAIKSHKSTSFDNEYTGMLLRFYVAMFFSAPLFIFNMGDHFTPLPWLWEFTKNSYFNYIQLIMSTPVVIWCGWSFFERGWESVISKNLNMFTLITLGVGVSYTYSIMITLIPTFLVELFGDKIVLDVYFEPAAVITTFVLLGQVLELKSRSKTNNAVKELFELTPATATMIFDDQTEREVTISEIKAGDLLHIKPGDKIPVDGVIINGESSINQSMMTGESMPISKKIDDFVIGGSLNGTGSFIMKATKVGSDTMISQIVDMVSNAQRTKAPIQKLVDQVSSYFVPMVILVAFVTFVSWYIYGPQPKLGYAIFTGVAVLIVACPCALGLATPMSIMVGVGRGAKEGILIKSAGALETLAKVNVLVIDKTGTITEGKPSLVEISSIDTKHDQTKLLELAASLEKNSEHPLAKAILRAAEHGNISLQECNNFRSLTGQGISGKIGDLDVAIGNAILMESMNININSIDEHIDQDKQLGSTIVFIAINKKLAGYMIATDKIKSDAKVVIGKLQKLGVRVVMLTGDGKQTAQKIAEQVEITEMQAEMLPQHKFEYIKNLQSKGLIVAMAGDGINDSPALTQANVGIAMGNGSDIAIESADIILVQGNLTGILNVKKLSSDIVTNIKENLLLAFIYNIVAIPIAAGIFYPMFGILLSPVIASVAMSFSSVSVILNALRLARYKYI